MAVSLTYDKQLDIVTGASRMATVWTALSLRLSDLYSRLETPFIGTETLTDYLALSKADQDSRKDVGGFVAGQLKAPRRKAENVLNRCIVTLDFDTIPPYGTQTVLDTTDALGCGYCIYSTRKHRPEAPRLRILLPTDRLMTTDEYDAVARKVAEDLGITMADPTTFEAGRLMYWPSCCSDGEYIFRYADRPFLSVDTVLGRYTDWKDWSERPQVPGSTSYQKLAVRQGDPESKPGIIGAFCRTYDVYKAMDELLPGIYEQCDNDPCRFTYLGGSTTGGAVVYDGGKFLYSHHATDPCGGRLVNAADLVRLHKFGHLDDDAALGTPVSRLPSYKAFQEFAVADKKVSSLILQERFQEGQKAFAAVAGGGATQATAAAGSSNVDDWGLDVSSKGKIDPTINNMLLILQNDPQLKDGFALNKFAGRVEVLGPLPWDASGIRRTWADSDVNGLYWYMEVQYALTKRQNVDSALDIYATSNGFNEVQDYLDGLTWDGKLRLDTALIDYLGAEDSAYTRAVTRKAFTAAVARVMEPGCKFDNMLVLCGPQGLGKSTLLKKMGRVKWFTDTIDDFEGKNAAEKIQGVWLVEIAEMEAFNRSEVSRIKQFLSTSSDRYRAAYGRNVKDQPRTCVFFGTCNDREFLRDKTGNRRFWPVDVGLPHKLTAFNDLTDAVVDQIWAEAKLRWTVGEELFLTGEAEEQARAMQAQHMEADPSEGMIADFISKPVPVDWAKWSLDRRRDWWAGATHGDVMTGPRKTITAIEVWCELYNGSKRDLRKSTTREINAVLASLPDTERASSPLKSAPYGSQRGFYVVSKP